MADEDPLDAFFEDVKETAKAMSEKRLDELKCSIESSKNSSQEKSENKAVVKSSDPLDDFMADVNATVTPANLVSSTDPLDEFMADVKATVSGTKTAKMETIKKGKLNEVLTDSNEHDGLDAYLEGKRRQKLEKDLPSVPNLLEYDSDENVMGKIEKPENLVLPPVDHTKIEYEDFHKDFYNPSKDIRNMSQEDVANIRHSLELVVTGVKSLSQAPPPVSNFKQVGFDAKLTLAIAHQGFVKPTAIQAQSIPAILKGYDLIAMAKTGSGKTFAFVWPMLTHIMDQRELEKGEGPIAVVLAPTRELAHQIYVETKRYAKIYGCKVCAIYGGVNKWEQIKALRQLCEVVVATPGRLIDMIKAKACPMNRVTFLVLDEADQMLSYGFEPQVRTIANQIRPDRQTVFFSATFNKKLKLLARDILCNPLEIRTGTFGSHDLITQQFIPFESDNEKWNWLSSNLKQFVQNGKVLIFVSQKDGCEELANNINNYLRETPCVNIHGDKTQPERAQAIKDFKGNVMVLVATDVASRGLHIANVNTVICFDAARNIDSHTHRIGRTGRMGKDGAKPGKAYVLLTKNDTKFSQVLLKTLQGAKQKIPQFLYGFARSRGGNGSSTVGNVQVNKGKRRRVNQNPGDWSQRGSGRSDVSSAQEKTVGLGYCGSTKLVWRQKDVNTHLYSVFVKGDELKPRIEDAAPAIVAKSGLSREERNSLKFTISHQAVAKQWGEEISQVAAEKPIIRKSRWDEMKTEPSGNNVKVEEPAAPKRKSRWDEK